jgi:hypothetical protein
MSLYLTTILSPTQLPPSGDDLPWQAAINPKKSNESPVSLIYDIGPPTTVFPYLWLNKILVIIRQVGRRNIKPIAK